MLDGHKVTIEDRPATCCKTHRDTWVVCSCGWENNCRLDGSVNSAITGHRLTAIEDVLNEKHRERKRMRSTGVARGTWL